WLSILLGPGKFSEVCKKCHKDAKCENKNGSEKCLCNLGYTGDGIKFCADDDECQNVTDICGKNANCTNTLGSYFCTCNPGFKSTGLSSFQTNDGTLCEDIDECKNEKVCGPFSHCHNTNGSYYCSCQRGYDPVSETKPKDGRFCIESPKKNCHLNDTCISKIVNKTIGSMTNITKPLPLLEEIRKQTSGELSPVDVISYVEALSHSVTLLNPVDDTSTNMEALANETITEFISTVNNLVEKDEMNAWYKIKTEDRERTITKLLHTVEEATLSISKNYKTSTEVEIWYVHASMDHNLINVLSSSTGNVSIVFLHYNGISNLLKHSNDRPVMDYEQFAEDFTVASQVIAVALKPANIYKVEHITFSLKHSQPVDSEAHVTKCAFWEYSPPIMKGRWATTGCERSHANRSHTTCSCNHLTHFAILMSSGRADLFCSIVAMLLHYFFLAAFAWMCIEGIHLYLIVAGVIYNKGFLHRNFYIFGYGSPAVVVIISATLGYKYYGTNKACWLSTENNFIWSFIGPACLIILVNLLAFGVIIYKVYRHTAIKKPEISHYENIRSCARGALALLFVLGATWTFGILHILHETTATAYLFTIFNVFQGMFIFIFLCVLSRKFSYDYAACLLALGPGERY
ncbi:EGF, latrophilin and seven transmembrane domain containing 1 precursor-like, partial [Scleropages formosus]